MNEVPIIDLKGGQNLSDDAYRSIAKQVNEALERVGFFVITNFGMAPGLIAKTQAVAYKYFDLPQQQKLKDLHSGTGRTRGYLSRGSVALASTYNKGKTPPDLQESYTARPDEAGVFAGWPEKPSDFQPIIQKYYKAVESIGWTLLRVLAEALKIDREYFVERYVGHQSALQLIHYPQQEVAPLPGQLRSGEHTDYGGITILAVQKDAPGGLQVRLKSGEWVGVAAPADSLIINIGDLMMRWTNDIWLSNLHRVINPPSELAAKSRRLSLVFFFNPNSNVVVECIPTCVRPGSKPLYGPVAVEDYLVSKIRQSAPAA
jgi:isopenicillin N synthase-like dioxygenase